MKKRNDMQTFNLNCWEEFEPKVNELLERFAIYDLPRPPLMWPVRFRGQASADWKLETTLERRSQRRWSVSEYLKLILDARPFIETQIDRRWEIPSWEKCMEAMHREYDGRIKIPYYDYWVYLRHYSFPSPLLDWSSSPFIAAYFAFSELPATQCNKVAVFMYVEMPNGHKGWDPNKPHLTAHGTEACLDRRHFNQKCWYTTATVRYNTDFHFASHESVPRPKDGSYDLILKITLPTAERNKALSQLLLQGISAFTLFGTEDALAKDLSFRCFDSSTSTTDAKDSGLLENVSSFNRS